MRPENALPRPWYRHGLKCSVLSCNVVLVSSSPMSEIRANHERVDCLPVARAFKAILCNRLVQPLTTTAIPIRLLLATLHNTTHSICWCQRCCIGKSSLTSILTGTKRWRKPLTCVLRQADGDKVHHGPIAKPYAACHLQEKYSHYNACGNGAWETRPGRLLSRGDRYVPLRLKAY